MIKLKGKTYRNTQEQVCENANDIAEIKQELANLGPTDQEIIDLKRRVTILENKTLAIEEYLNDLTISSSMIQEGAITTTKINDGAVKTAKINDGAVTIEKVSNSIANILQRKLYSHHISIEVVISSIGYNFLIDIISTRDTAFNYGALWNYMYVQGQEFVYCTMLDGEGSMVAWDEDITVMIYSKKGDKIDPRISIDLSQADSYTIHDQIIEIF